MAQKKGSPPETPFFAFPASGEGGKIYHNMDIFLAKKAETALFLLPASLNSFASSLSLRKK